MSIYNLYNNLVDSGKYSMVPSSNYQQNLENNIKQNYSGANYFRNSTSEMAKDYVNRAETPTGKALMNYVMAAGAVPVGAASFPYDAYQALNRYDKAPAPEIGLDSIVPENMYRGKTNFINTYKKEQPITAAYNRAMGMVDPLAGSLSQELANFNLKNTLSNMFSTKANAFERPSENTLQARQTRQASSPRALGAEDIKEEGIFSLGDILADLGRRGVEGFKNVAGRGIASQGLGTAGGMILGPLGAIAGGIAGLVGGGDLFNSNSLSQRNFDMLSSEGKKNASSLYNPGGLLSGYNQFSAFGKGAKGTIDKSIGRIMRTLQKKDSPFLQDRLGKLQAARDKITGTNRDESGKITGGSGQGTIDSGNKGTGGYGGTGGEGPSAVGSSGMLGGGT